MAGPLVHLGQCAPKARGTTPPRNTRSPMRRKPLNKPEPDWCLVREVARRAAHHVAPHRVADELGDEAVAECFFRHASGMKARNWYSFARRLAHLGGARWHRARLRHPFEPFDIFDAHHEILSQNQRSLLLLWFRDVFLPNLTRTLTPHQNRILSELTRHTTITGIGRSLCMKPKDVRRTIKSIVDRGKKLNVQPPPKQLGSRTSHQKLLLEAR